MFLGLAEAGFFPGVTFLFHIIIFVTEGYAFFK